MRYKPTEEDLKRMAEAGIKSAEAAKVLNQFIGDLTSNYQISIPDLTKAMIEFAHKNDKGGN